jgi:transcriptional regulator with XRE-family HTH domain
MLKENLRQLRKRQGLSQEEVSKVLGVSRITYGDYERGKTEPNIESLRRLASLFKISLDSLISGNTASLLSDATNQGDIKILAITVDSENKGNIDLVRSKARAGYAQQFSNPEFVKDLPKIYFPSIPQGTYRGFEIEGDSMLPLDPGSIVICSYVEKLQDIKTGKCYVLVLKDEGLVYKRVSFSSSRDAIILASDNKSYSPYQIHPSEIAEIWSYYAHLSFTENILSFRPNNKAD